MNPLTGELQFSDYKRKTKPLFKVVGSIQQSIPIHKMYEDGIFEVESSSGVEHTFDKAYLISDINYTLKNEEEKEKVLLTFFKILNSFECDFKIHISNTKRDMESFKEKITYHDCETELEEMKDAQNKWILDNLKKGKPGIDQTKYLILTVKKKTYEEAKFYFSALEGVIIPLFESMQGKPKLELLSIYDRLLLLKKIYRMEEKVTVDKENFSHRDIKNDIIPARIEQEKEYMKIGKTFVSTLFSLEFPNKVDEEKVISSLSNLPYPSMLTLDYAPIPTVAIQKKLTNANRTNEFSIELEKERKSKNKNYSGEISYKKQKKKDELEEYMQQVADDDEGGFFFSILISITAKTKEELDQRRQEIEATAKGLGLMLEPYYYKQLKAFNTALPVGCREVNLMRSMLTSSVVAFHPFYTKELLQRGGQFFGINRVSKNPIILNRKRLKNGNGIVSGHSGGGKSVYLKNVEVSQVLLGTHDDVFIIDPQNEFQELAGLYKGQFFDLSAKSGIHLNLLEIPKQLFEEGYELKREEFVADKVSFVLAFLTSVMTNLTVTGIHESIITECLMELYESFFHKKKSPLLIDLYNKFLSYEKEHERDSKECREIYKPLEVYTKGVFDMFSKHTNIDIHNRFVVFGIKNITTQIWEPVMLVIMHLLSQRMNYNQAERRATRFIVDEGQLVCTRKTSALQLTKAFLTYRKFGGICTLALQNMSVAIANEVTAALVDNCEFKICLDQGGIDKNEIMTIMDLSSKEADALTEEVAGYSLIKWGKDTLLCDGVIEEDNPMFSIFSTKFHEE